MLHSLRDDQVILQYSTLTIPEEYAALIPRTEAGKLIFSKKTEPHRVYTIPLPYNTLVELQP